jgi:hypothetical protein
MLPVESLQRGASEISDYTSSRRAPLTSFSHCSVSQPLAIRADVGVPKPVAMGFFYLSTVSSTISSAVGLTAVAGWRTPPVRCSTPRCQASSAFF